MLLRWRCCYVEDVVALKMLVVTLKMLLRWRCCCVEDVVTLKMLLRWRCCCEYFQNGFADVKRPSCAFRAWFAGDLWHFMSIKRNPKMKKKHWKKHAILMEPTKITYNEKHSLVTVFGICIPLTGWIQHDFDRNVILAQRQFPDGRRAFLAIAMENKLQRSFALLAICRF